MTLTIPLYAEERRPKREKLPVFTVRPLFVPEVSRTHAQLSRATGKLAEDLRRKLDALAVDNQQGALAEWAFNPTLEEHHVRIDLTLRRQTAKFGLFVLTFESLDRRLAIMPQFPRLTFEVLRGQTVERRANEVLTEYYLAQEKESDDFTIPEELTAFCNSWMSSIEIDVDPKPQLDRPSGLDRLFLGARGKTSGREELLKVGRCIDWLFPDELERAQLRESEVEELSQRLADIDRRPMLLLGPRGSGKTAVLHETVYRRVEKLSSPHVSKRNVWHLSPQRLISGMAYVGQWENRLLAILDEAKAKDHTLYFDDLLGLFHAGVSSSSDLNVAQVLRPCAERREVRLLAEMTPEAFRILQEKDRAFADLFHVIPITAMNEPQTRRVLIGSMRLLEARYNCVFGIDVMPTALDLQQRHARDLALPGKAAGFLRQLAYKHRNEGIHRQTALAAFHAGSGLSISFLDGEQKLERREILTKLGQHIIGQHAAVEAMADTVCIAKARLNDPGRPSATFLFLGPTGVGKTQAAKALAEYLFGSAERLVRFDMNEYVDAYSVARLVGTFNDPEGLLTSAVRRQPFCVLLLDEIEKAHPGVFDLLLQVTGEGRLTDARGRTVDFTGSIIIMTSNLGVRDASSSFGLRAASASDASSYVQAAERFFRPEFINRIDRIVPFTPLTREEIGKIARQLLNSLFHREGLVHRQCVLCVEPEAMEHIIDAGYHPELGARALKRTIERQITQPVAARLAAMEAGAPAVLSVYPVAGGVAAKMDALTHTAALPLAARKFATEDPELILDCVETFVDRIESQLRDLHGGGGLMQGQISTEQFRYLALREQVDGLIKGIARIDRQLTARKSVRRAGPPMRTGSRAVRGKRLSRFNSDLETVWKMLTAAESFESGLSELITDDDTPENLLEDQLVDLLEQCALLETMATDEPTGGRAMLLMRPLIDAPTQTELLSDMYREFSVNPQSGSISRVTATFMRSVIPKEWDLLLADFPGAYGLLRREQGTHLFYPYAGSVIPVQVWVMPVGETDDTIELTKAFLAKHRAYRDAAISALSDPDADPMRLLPVVRIYAATATVDLHSGLAARSYPSAADFRRFVFSTLPLPKEFSQ